MAGKRRKQEEELDDRTVADMNVEGMPWYRDAETKKRDKERAELKVTQSERRAMMKGAFAAMLPAFFIGLGIFCLAFALIMLYFRFVIG